MVVGAKIIPRRQRWQDIQEKVRTYKHSALTLTSE